mgnify:CR=1 FL=1
MIGILFIIFGVYLVNRYLIPRVDSKIANTQTEKNEEKYEITENTYTSNEIKIKIDKKEEGEGKDKVTYYIADIKIENWMKWNRSKNRAKQHYVPNKIMQDRRKLI